MKSRNYDRKKFYNIGHWRTNRDASPVSRPTPSRGTTRRPCGRSRGTSRWSRWTTTTGRRRRRRRSGTGSPKCDLSETEKRFFRRNFLKSDKKSFWTKKKFSWNIQNYFFFLEKIYQFLCLLPYLFIQIFKIKLGILSFRHCSSFCHSGHINQAFVIPINHFCCNFQSHLGIFITLKGI